MTDWHHHHSRWRRSPLHWARHFPWGILYGMSSWKRSDEGLSRFFKKWRMNFPFADFDETEEEYIVKLEVPGIEKDKISAKASEGNLTIEIEEEPYYYPIPSNIDTENVYATLKLGILTVHLPKKEPDKKVNIDF